MQSHFISQENPEIRSNLKAEINDYMKKNFANHLQFFSHVFLTLSQYQTRKLNIIKVLHDTIPVQNYDDMLLKKSEELNSLKLKYSSSDLAVQESTMFYHLLKLKSLIQPFIDLHADIRMNIDSNHNNFFKNSFNKWNDINQNLMEYVEVINKQVEYWMHHKQAYEKFIVTTWEFLVWVLYQTKKHSLSMDYYKKLNSFYTVNSVNVSIDVKVNSLKIYTNNLIYTTNEKNIVKMSIESILAWTKNISYFDNAEARYLLMLCETDLLEQYKQAILAHEYLNLLDNNCISYQRKVTLNLAFQAYFDLIQNRLSDLLNNNQNLIERCMKLEEENKKLKTEQMQAFSSISTPQLFSPISTPQLFSPISTPQLTDTSDQDFSYLSSTQSHSPHDLNLSFESRAAWNFSDSGDSDQALSFMSDELLDDIPLLEDISIYRP